MATDVTAAALRQALLYSPETGLFTWATAGRKRRIGCVAGTINTIGYVLIGIEGRQYLAHRLAFLFMTGAWPRNEVDHINGQRSDNRWSNLRDVQRTQNAENQRSARSTSKTGVLGVTKIGNRFQAAISIDGKQRKLGYFDTAEQAAQAYIDAKRVHHIGCTL